MFYEVILNSLYSALSQPYYEYGYYLDHKVVVRGIINNVEAVEFFP